MPRISISILAVSLLLSVDAFGQHDPGRNAVRLLAKGETDAAIKLASKAPRRMNSPISDAERHFVLAMAACRRGDSAGAFKHAKQAVEGGLPIERIQAGPRDFLKPLYAHSEFKTWLAGRGKGLLHGPLVGALTDSSTSFWVRTSGEADVRILVRAVTANKSDAKPLVADGRTSAGSDYTATIRASGLAPDTRYTYEVLVGGKAAGAAAEFRTFPKPGAAGRFRIAFGGGAGFTPKYERMWTTLGKRKLRALLLLGDNVYIDDPTGLVTQRYCYYRRQSQVEWRGLVASIGVFSIYDDHDFGTNDCEGGPDIDRPQWKRKVWEVFRQNWSNPGYGGGAKHPGCWYDFHIGDVLFIMLDCRYYRDLKGGSMLGAVQKKWLLGMLRSSKGKFKVLVSSVPWSPGVKPGSKDTWDGFAAEREEIFSFIEKHRIDGVILMAADRHRSDLRRIRRAGGYDLYEVMSSRLTNVHTHGLVKNARGSEFIMGYNRKCSFGLLDFDTAVGDPRVKYTIVNIDNEAIDSRTLKLSQLSFSVRDGNRQQAKSGRKDQPDK
ncbi:MAG: alkaline phosphatase D family protein [Phycisphaerae bacterium]|jgi:alkaline phosphatase D|nr:alkaline phosphatase D family protein [Phycisphaerae bacterium]